MKNRNKYIICIALLFVGNVPTFPQVSNDNEDGVNKIVSRPGRNDFVPGQVLVKFKDGKRVQVNRARGQFESTSIDAVTAVLHKFGADEMEQLLPHENPDRQLSRTRAYNGEIIQERDLSQLFLVKIAEEKSHETLQLVDALQGLDEVEYAEPNYYCYITTAEGNIAESHSANELVRKQWYLDAYGVKELWDKTIINKERPVIAIIDTGVDTNHPDLKDNCIEGYDFVNNTSNVIDDNMHGTHVAGIAAAVNNDLGIVGANPLAFIMPVKVLDANGRGNTATILQGVSYAIEHGAKVLNLSLGGYGYSKAAADVYRNASTKAVIVAAAGNDGKCIYASHEGLLKHGIKPEPSFPAAYPFVFGVQATNRKGELAGFSNYDDDGPLYSGETSIDEPDGFNYELKAPGTEILSTLPNGNYGELQGTSMASPLVAGAISALMMVKQYDSQEQLWAELLHTNNIAEAFELKELPADLDVVRVMLRERKEFSDETEEAFSGINEVNAGETINIYPVVRCTVGDASNIKLKLEVDENEDSNCVEIVTGEVDFGWHLDAMGKAVSKNPLVVKIPTDIADSRHIRMRITVSCENQEGTSYQSFTFLANNMETISGILTENTTLYDGHTYYVDGNLVVNEDVTLTIEPGARLEFAENKGLTSLGKLIAKGTPEKPIVFTRHSRDERWEGIQTRKTKKKQSHSDLYTNADSTLFTLVATEFTSIPISFGITFYYNPITEENPEKRFDLNTYIKGWERYKEEDMTFKQELLTDPTYITPTVLNILNEWKQYCSKFPYSTEKSKDYGYDYSRAEVNIGNPMWCIYENPTDTISYCKLEGCDLNRNDTYYSYPYMENCMLTECSARSSIDGQKNTFTLGYPLGDGVMPKQKWDNYVNNDVDASVLYSDLKECNLINFSNYYGYVLSIEANEPTVDHSYYPSYLGTSREDLIRPRVFEIGSPLSSTWGTIDLSNMRKTPVSEAHGIVWKVVVNGKDAQDEYEDLAPLGVGRHKFEVYFNRPMNKEVTPLVSFGVRDPWTQHSVDEDGSWNADGTIYTVYKTITGKMKSDGVNRIYVRGAEDDEFFPCPYEKTRFNVNVQVAGSMATGFEAEAGLGCVNLKWTEEGNDFEDAMGINIYRFSNDITKTIPGYRDENWNWIEERTVPDTIRINKNIVNISETAYADFDVKPKQTYHYLYKVISTDLKEYDVSNIVAATPLTATLGDANGSGDVDVSDVVTTVNYAVGRNPSPFVFDAADMNSDKMIDVLDVIGIVQTILNPTATSRAIAEETAQAIYTIEDDVLYVESPVSLAGIQVQLALNEKTRMKSDEFTAAQSLTGFEQASAWLTDSDYLLLTYSLGGKTIEPGKHALLYIGDSKLSTLRLADEKGRNVHVVSGNTTYVGSLGHRVMTETGVFNLKGQKVAGSSDNLKALKSGIYIVNGQKIVK